MPKVTAIQTNFSSGEFSPFLDGRVNVARYYNSAKTLENFIILPYGGTKRRPGTYYVAEVKDSARKSRLIPFQFSTTQAYIIELADRIMRFYFNNGQMLSGGSAYEISTPYLEADLFDIQFAQDADTMWLVHPSYKPRKLTRNAPSWDSYTKLMLHMDGADGSTTFTDAVGTHTVTANGNAQIDTAQYVFGGAGGKFDGAGDYLDIPDHDDFNLGTADFSIDFRIKLNTLSGTHVWILADNPAYTYRIRIESVSGVWKWNVEGFGDSTLKVGSVVTNTWYHVALVRKSGTLYLYVNGIELGNAVSTADIDLNNWRIGEDLIGTQSDLDGWIDEFRWSKGVARWSSNFTPPTEAYAADIVTFSLNNYAPELMTLDVAPGGSGWAAGDTITGQTSGATCVIVSVTDTTHYRVKDRSGTYTLGEILTNGTDTADQGASYPTLTGDPFGADASDDCPSCVAIHEQRIIFANTNNDPQKVWASVSGDYEDMTTGTNDGDAFTYTIGSEQVNAIRWLSSGRILGMGTLGGVFSMSSGSDEVAITPTNVVVKRETSYGALGIMPKRIGNFVYYVQRNAKTLREFAYSYDYDQYIAADVTILAEHITGSEIVCMDYQQSPYNILWCVRSDGVLACLTRQIQQEVIAWSRQIMGGNFNGDNAVVESVAVIPGDGGDDEVWITVKRTINNATKRYIEYFKPMDFGDEQEDGFFVDSGLTLDVPKPISDITQASPGVVTATAHGFSDGDIVIIRGVKGMTEVNKQKYKVAGATSNTFQLTDVDTGDNIDTSGYTTYSSGGEVRKCVTTISGLDHLEGESIAVCVDGVEGTASAVSGGSSTISSPSNGGGEIHAGLAYTSTLKTMRLEAGSAIGTAQSKLKRISKIYAMVVDSYAMSVGNDDQLDVISFSDDDFLFSGWKELTFPSKWDRDGYIKITQDKPLPLILLSIVFYMTTSDG